jgi:hypothetical protein
MLGRLHDYWRKAHEDSEWQSEEQIVRRGRGEGVAASSECRQENGTGISYAHLCVGEREGRCEETVTLIPYSSQLSAISSCFLPSAISHRP